MGIIYGYANPKGKILYIGQTVNLEQRHNKHFKHDPYNEKVLEYNYPLSRGIRKHGEKYYSLVILEENIDNCLLNDKEMFYISKYDTFRNGYNQTPGGSIPPTITYKDEIILEVIKLLKTDLSYKDISEKTGLSFAHIDNINNGKRRKFSDIEYPIRKNQIGTRGRKLTQEQVDKIADEIKDGIKSFDDIASEYNISQTTVSKINSGVRKSSYSNFPIRPKKKH